MSKYEENGIEIDGLDEIEVENTAVDDLESESINLMFLGIDESQSMWKFIKEMLQCLLKFKNALENSKEADEILVARADFAGDIKIGGYKKISEFDTGFDVYGCTAMYNTIVEGVEKLQEYRNFLKEQGMRVKVVFAMFSDGKDEGSRSDFRDAKKSIDFLNDEEITTAFVAFGDKALEEAQNLGFRNILDVYKTKGKDLESKLREALECLSKSVIVSSKSVLADGDDFFQI